MSMCQDCVLSNDPMHWTKALPSQWNLLGLDFLHVFVLLIVLWWCDKYVSSSRRGRPWEGGRMEWWTSESCSSSNLNKGWMSILVLGLNWNRPGLARPSLTKDGRARSSFPWFDLYVRKSLWFSDLKLLQSPIKRRFRYHNFHNSYESHNPRSGYITAPRMLYKHGPAQR